MKERGSKQAIMTKERGTTASQKERNAVKQRSGKCRKTHASEGERASDRYRESLGRNMINPILTRLRQTDYLLSLIHI